MTSTPAATFPSGTIHRIHPEDALREKEIVQLTVGVLDADAVAVFTEGWCWALAVALEARTGWPIVLLVTSHGLWVHAGVRRPDGKVVDIEGPSDPETWVRKWEARERQRLHDDGASGTLTACRASAAQRYTFGLLCGSIEDEALAIAGTFVEAVLQLRLPSPTVYNRRAS